MRDTELAAPTPEPSPMARHLPSVADIVERLAARAGLKHGFVDNARRSATPHVVDCHGLSPEFERRAVALRARANGSSEVIARITPQLWPLALRLLRGWLLLLWISGQVSEFLKAAAALATNDKHRSFSCSHQRFPHVL